MPEAQLSRIITFLDLLHHEQSVHVDSSKSLKDQAPLPQHLQSTEQQAMKKIVSPTIEPSFTYPISTSVNLPILAWYYISLFPFSASAQLNATSCMTPVAYNNNGYRKPEPRRFSIIIPHAVDPQHCKRPSPCPLLSLPGCRLPPLLSVRLLPCGFSPVLLARPLFGASRW